MIQLHENEELFAELIEITAEFFGLPQVYVEKDYWITKALQYLSRSPHVHGVVFKGGTSLSKAYKLIERFSEDIDLAIIAYDKSDSARKKLLKDVERVVSTGLLFLKNDERESKGSKYRKTVYQYPRNVDGIFGQASPELLLEINSFTKPEPFHEEILQTLIAEVLENKNRKDLIEEYGLESFSVNVLSVQRTLVEKIIRVVKDSYDENPIDKLSGRIRHLYDICSILRKEEYRDFVSSKEFKLICDICIEDEMLGFKSSSDCFTKALVEAPIFSKFKVWRKSLDLTYTNSFSSLVYGDLPEMDDIEDALAFIKEHI